MSKAESEAILQGLLDFLQRDRRIRFGIGLLIIGGLMFFAVKAGIGLIPKEHSISLCGGDIVNNRHYIARVVQQEAAKVGLTVTIKPTPGTNAVLEKVSAGEVDAAFIQGGLERRYPNIEHVAAIMPEMLHFLVRQDINSFEDLGGHSVNLSGKKSGTREVAYQVLQFAEYQNGFHYAETNYEAEQLLALPDRKMPAGIFTVSSVPSQLVDELVTHRGYKVLEIPFPQALALRHGWAGTGKILAYTYDIQPPVPAKDITTVSINMYLVANKHADQDAVAKLLAVLFSPSVQSRLGLTLEEKNITQPSGYPLSEGTTKFLKRNDSLLTQETWSKLQGMFGLIMTFGGMFVVVIKWFRGPVKKPEMHDKEFHGYLAEVVAIEKELSVIEASGSGDLLELRAQRDKLNALHVQMLERYPQATLKDAKLFERCDVSVRNAIRHVGNLVMITRQRSNPPGARQKSAPPPPGAA